MKALLAAAAVALLAPTLPFPAPKLIAISPELKCDWGPITEVKTDRTELVVRTDAGPFEVKLGAALREDVALPTPSAEGGRSTRLRETRRLRAEHTGSSEQCASQAAV